MALHPIFFNLSSLLLQVPFVIAAPSAPPSWCRQTPLKMVGFSLRKNPWSASKRMDRIHFLNYDNENNVVAVRVCHEDIADSRWFTGSGITRKVTLLQYEEVYPCEYGIFFQTPKVSDASAEIVVENGKNPWSASKRMDRIPTFCSSTTTVLPLGSTTFPGVARARSYRTDQTRPQPSKHRALFDWQRD